MGINNMHADTDIDIGLDVGGPHATSGREAIRAAVVWGVVFGILRAAAPLMVWWLRPGTVYALSLVLIASVYIGFAVADGRPVVIAVECSIATIFAVVAAAAITGPAWLLVIGLVGHGLKDLWQHRYQFVSGTRWWPPFCCAVDFVAAALIGIAITQRVL